MSRDPTIEELFRAFDTSKAKRLEYLPTEQDCLRLLGQIHSRLQELGWKEAIYCPKDGTVFHAIEFGSIGIHDCHYHGEWPDGSWWVHEAHDLWPSHPIMFKPKNRAAETSKREEG